MENKRIFSLLMIVTVALLLYVHEQISLFRVSYSIQAKERQVAELGESYKLAKFRVARLRSPEVLSQRMKQLSLNLTTPTEQEIIRILKPQLVSQEQTMKWPDPIHFLSWFHFIQDAQAKTPPQE